MVSAITTRYAAAKAKLKRSIQENMEQWISIGDQLRQIKESGDWQQDCKSWAEFCRNCCTFSLRFADQLVADTKAWIPLKEALMEAGTVFHTFTQLAVREIAKIEDKSERLDIALEITKEEPSKPIGPAAVKKAREKRAKARVIEPAAVDPIPVDPAPTPGIPCCPTCKRPL